MPKKEKGWMWGTKGPVGPWVWRVWTAGSRQPIRMVAFDLQHIQDQLPDKKITKFYRVPEEKEPERLEPLGPKGSVVNRPADYDTAFKLLKEWVDHNGGIPEKLRLKMRELYVPWDKTPQKTTRYSAKKKGRHKI